MAHSTWKDLCKQPTLTASSEKYAQLVHDSTIQLHQGVQLILSALDRRAIGFTKSANFDSALRDAQVMQKLSPSSALGYIREAGIYSEQGKQFQVIGICNKGLSMIDTNDTHYGTLQRAKTDAEQRQSTYIDFIKQLPTDIVITTLIPMFMEDPPMISATPRPCLYVSNLWRNRIIQCFNGLRFEIRAKASRGLSHLIEFSRFIKTLDVDSVSEDPWLWDLLRNNGFCSLRELSINWYYAARVDHLISSLTSIGQTLTHFQALQHCASVASAADIMRCCPNLVSLDIFQPVLPDFTSTPMTTWPKLTDFRFFCGGGAFFTRDHIPTIHKHFPSLKRLSIYPCEDTQMTRIVLDYYPRMKALQLVHGVYIELTYREQGKPCKDIAITDLYIESECREYFPWDFLAHELRQHQDTLEHIECEMSVEDEDVEEIDVEQVYPIEYKRLKQLDLVCYGWWLLRNAPMLEQLKIQLLTKLFKCFAFLHKSPHCSTPHIYDIAMFYIVR